MQTDGGMGRLLGYISGAANLNGWRDDLSGELQPVMGTSLFSPSIVGPQRPTSYPKRPE